MTIFPDSAGDYPDIRQVTTLIQAYYADISLARPDISLVQFGIPS